ncbi:MAG: hypothetical protein C4330_12445 [Chitinophagaceae bacterium]
MRSSTIFGFTKAAWTALALAVLTQSCQKSADLQATETPITEAHLAELKASIASTTGAPVSQIDYSAATKTFTVSKDAKLSLADAENYFKVQPIQGAPSTERTSQRVNMYTVNSTKVRNITLYCDASVPSDWISIMDQAIANWNATGSAVHFTRVTSQSTTTTTSGGGGRKKNGSTTTTTTISADVVANSFNDNTTSTIAQAYYPLSTGAPGNQININLHYTYLSSSYRVFALTHELGHIVGFTHTDQTYGNLIAGTPDVDPSSVMNSVCLSWVGFTNYDLTAFRTVYPY